MVPAQDAVRVRRAAQVDGQGKIELAEFWQGEARIMIQQTRWIVEAMAGIALGAILLIPAQAFAQDKSPAQPDNAAHAAPSAGDSTKSGTPQASLAKIAGDYTRIIKFTGQPDVAPSMGTAKISVVLGGKFILEESTDTVFGQSVEGMRIYGYNDAAKQYEMARMNTMSTAITMMKGTSKDGGKTIDFTGETDSGRGKTPLHAQLRQVNENQFVVTLFTTGPDGKESAFQETDYARKR
jgi:hypothetical protein